MKTNLDEILNQVKNETCYHDILGFELFVKRAKIGKAKHVRVRPMFRNWEAEGTLTVLDEEASGLKHANLQRILDLAGAMVGLGDWRPSSPTPGCYGRFTAQVIPM